MGVTKSDQENKARINGRWLIKTLDLDTKTIVDVRTKIRNMFSLTVYNEIKYLRILWKKQFDAVKERITLHGPEGYTLMQVICYSLTLYLL